MSRDIIKDIFDEPELFDYVMVGFVFVLFGWLVLPLMFLGWLTVRIVNKFRGIK